VTPLNNSNNNIDKRTKDLEVFKIDKILLNKKILELNAKILDLSNKNLDFAQSNLAENLKLNAKILELNNKNSDLVQRNLELSLEIADIHRSITWQILIKYNNIVDPLLPSGTKRRQFYGKIIYCGRTLINDGLNNFITIIKNGIKKRLSISRLIIANSILYKYRGVISLVRANNIPENIGPSPSIDIIIPVYNHDRYLDSCIKSALSQTYNNLRLILIEDHSPDPSVKEILRKYLNNTKITISFNKENLGLSRTLNEGIIKSSGDYLAFLDCDDLIVENAIEKVVNFIRTNPNKKFIYSDRINIDINENPIEYVTFRNRSTDAKNELLNGMYTSHLKVIKRDSFLESGLFSPRFDSAQDYDLALRISEKFEFGYINEYLYKHRIHEGQVTRKSLEKQESLAMLAKNLAVKRRKIMEGKFDKLTSIVMLMFNRIDDTKRAIESIYEHTRLPFELIILDNASTDPDVHKYLNSLSENKNNIKVIFSEENLGCSGGRKKAIEFTRGEYIVTLDNDICVTHQWLENLILRIDDDDKIVAACSKVVFPNGIVQYNGGKYEIRNGFISFSLLDSNKDKSDLSTLMEKDCDWIPGGASIIKKEFLKKVNHREELAGAYEDNDYSLQIKNAGGKMVNCPLSQVVHHHLQFNIKVLLDKDYIEGRYNKDKLMKSFVYFYKFNYLIIKDPDLYNMLGISGKNDDEIKSLMREQLACIHED
jgi:GT2 family glycosyltransferase